MRASREFKSKRGGFTLVEILVVLAIIAVLAGLVAAGVFALIASQRRTNTQNTMRAVYKALSRQMKSVVDKADQETIPASVLSLAGNDAKRARVIWKKLRLKQEFPMTFAEALAPSNNWNGSASVVPATDLPPLPAYVKAMQQAGIVTNATLNPGKWSNNNNQPLPQPFIESSTLILLALQQNRGGVALKPDELGSYALDLNGDGLKELIDGWGNPIAFFRFPTTNDVSIAGTTDVTPGLPPGNNSLNSTNPASAGSTQAKFSDTYDPEGTLVNPLWNNAANPSVSTFEQLCHLVHAPNVSGGAYGGPWPRYMLPTLVSPGPDGKWGLNNMFSTSNGGYYGNGVNPDMSIDPNSVLDSNDNIYSYSLNLDN